MKSFNVIKCTEILKGTINTATNSSMIQVTGIRLGGKRSDSHQRCRARADITPHLLPHLIPVTVPYTQAFLCIYYTGTVSSVCLQTYMYHTATVNSVFQLNVASF